MSGFGIESKTFKGGEVGMIAVVILMILVSVLSVYSALGTYQNQQDIKDLTDMTKGIGINAKHIYQIFEMLKEQEAVKPLKEHSGGGTTWWNVCGACRTAINPNDKFCHECGRAVKWND